jgi:wyosine [tRNA(Phe)-imidazoG37] synthetase (radical SAM superfamily)
LIVNKLKNCCDDCVYCEIVTETKRRAIPERGAEWKIEVYAVLNICIY